MPFGTKNIKGSSLNDVIIGDENRNELAGNSGDDILEGKGEADILDGGTGIDTASYETSPSGVSVSLSYNATNTGGDAEGDKLYNIENLIGSNNSDTLKGSGYPVNILHGMAGNDTLSASDNDILIGGPDTDKFHIGEDAHNVVIKDFDKLSEKLDLSSWDIQYSDINIFDEESGSVVRFFDKTNQKVTITLEQVPHL